jgi:hypothetical protein
MKIVPRPSGTWWSGEWAIVKKQLDEFSIQYGCHPSMDMAWVDPGKWAKQRMCSPAEGDYFAVSFQMG